MAGREHSQPMSSDAVAISFKLRGITMEPLSQAKALMKAVKKALRAALAQECGQGIGTEHVAVSLSEGSIIVDANVWPPPSISCAFVKDRLKSSPTLLDTIQTWVNEVPNLDKVLTGPVKVSKSSVSVSIIRSGEEEAQLEEDISHQYAGDLHSSSSRHEQKTHESQPEEVPSVQLADARRILLQEQQNVMMKCKELQDCLAEAEQDVTALKSELDLARSRAAAPDVVSQRAERCWAYLVAAATYRWWMPANWSLRIQTVLAGSALASIKFDSEADEIAASTNRKAQIRWKWGRAVTFLVHRKVLGAHRDAILASDQFRRALMSWARIVSVISRSQAERESWVIQAWARLASMLDLVDVRSQGCSYKIEDVVRQWPRMAEFLLARNETDGWKLGIGRAGRLNAVLTRWRRLGHQVHIGAAHAEAQWGHDAASLIQQRMSGAAEEKVSSSHRQAEVTWRWGRAAALLLYRQAMGAHQDVSEEKERSEASWRASMSWARLTKKMQDQKDAQAEREHKVVQSWVRLIFRSQGCSYKIEDVVRQWPRMAEFLLARNETDGWKLGIGRAGRLNAVLTRWRRLGHQVHIGAAHVEAQWAHNAADLVQRRASSAAEKMVPVEEQQNVMMKCKELQDSLAEAEQDVTALRSELDLVRSRAAAPDVVSQRAERSWAYLVAVATCQARLPTMDWSSRISNVLSGSVLATMKVETKENDMVSSDHRQAEVTRRWGRAAALLLYRQAVGAHQDVSEEKERSEASWRASMSWARLTKKMQDQKDAQAEREHKVVQSWVRLIFRSQALGHRTEDIVKTWLRMADMLLSLSRACVLHGVVRRWRRQANQISKPFPDGELSVSLGVSPALRPDASPASSPRSPRNLEPAEPGQAVLRSEEIVPSADPKDPEQTLESGDVDQETFTSKRFQSLFNWMRFVTNLAPKKRDLGEIGLAVRRRQERKVKKIQVLEADSAALHEALRKQTAQTIAAHQMLFQESKRTLAHCKSIKRFQNELLPVGLEEQCQQALVKCQQMMNHELGLDERVEPRKE